MQGVFRECFVRAAISADFCLRTGPTVVQTPTCPLVTVGQLDHDWNVVRKPSNTIVEPSNTSVGDSELFFSSSKASTRPRPSPILETNSTGPTRQKTCDFRFL